MGEEWKNCGNIFRTVKDSTINIGDKLGLDENQVREMLSAASKDIIGKLSDKSEETVEKVAALVEDKFNYLICKLESDKNLSEQQVKKAAGDMLRELRADNSELVEAVKNDILTIGKKQDALSEKLDMLIRQYSYEVDMQAGKILQILSNRKETAQIELHFAYICLLNADFSGAQKFAAQAVSRADGAYPEAHYCLALAEYRVQPVFDYAETFRLIPLCYDWDRGKDFRDSDEFKFFNDNVKDGGLKIKGAEFAKKIDEIRKQFYVYAYDTKPKEGQTRYTFDCFICTKVRGDDGKDTQDYEWIKSSDLYKKLTDEGLAPFFSEIDCPAQQAEKGSLKYEALIEYALSESKCLILVCGNADYLTTPWVKNEIIRFCGFLEKLGMDKKSIKEKIVIINDGKEIKKLPNSWYVNSDQQITRTYGNDCVEQIVRTVRSSVNRGKGYIDIEKKVCPQCGNTYRSNMRVCPQCETVNLISATEYLNERRFAAEEEVRKKEEELKKEREEFKKHEAEFNAKIKAELQKKAEEAEKQVIKLQQDLKNARDAQSALAKQKDVCEKKLRVYDNAFAIIKKDERNRMESFNSAIKNLNSGLAEFDVPAELDKVNSSATLSSDSPLTDFEILHSLYADGTPLVELVRYKGKGGNVIIPDGVTCIGEVAFWYCRSLTNIHIPDGVRSIGKSAFGNCWSLTNIYIPDGVISIGESAFWYCWSLTSIILPKSLTQIGAGAFGKCTSLKDITFKGTAAEWKKIEKERRLVKSITVHCTDKDVKW